MRHIGNLILMKSHVNTPSVDSICAQKYNIKCQIYSHSIVAKSLKSKDDDYCIIYF